MSSVGQDSIACSCEDFDEGSADDILTREKSRKRAYDLGFQYEKTYHGCAQCAVAAIQDTLGLKDDGTFKAANALNAGLGCSSRGTCGALAGSAMVISSLCGRPREMLDDVNRIRARPYGPAQRLLEKFEREFGSGICEEIQRRRMGRSFNLLIPEQRDMFFKAGAEEIHCPDVVGKASSWAVEIILDGHLVDGEQTSTGA
jgi:C_GCAxxG_C_C family probable redox protein